MCSNLNKQIEISEAKLLFIMGAQLEKVTTTVFQNLANLRYIYSQKKIDDHSVDWIKVHYFVKFCHKFYFDE